MTSGRLDSVGDAAAPDHLRKMILAAAKRLLGIPAVGPDVAKVVEILKSAEFSERFRSGLAGEPRVVRYFDGVHRGTSSEAHGRYWHRVALSKDAQLAGVRKEITPLLVLVHLRQEIQSHVDQLLTPPGGTPVRVIPGHEDAFWSDKLVRRQRDGGISVAEAIGYHARINGLVRSQLATLFPEEGRRRVEFAVQGIAFLRTTEITPVVGLSELRIPMINALDGNDFAYVEQSLRLLHRVNPRYLSTGTNAQIEKTPQPRDWRTIVSRFSEDPVWKELMSKAGARLVEARLGHALRILNKVYVLTGLSGGTVKGKCFVYETDARGLVHVEDGRAFAIADWAFWQTIRGVEVLPSKDLGKVPGWTPDRPWEVSPRGVARRIKRPDEYAARAAAGPVRGLDRLRATLP